MGINRNNPDQWKTDIAKSVDYYNRWFIEFAPKAYQETRNQTIQAVKHVFDVSNNFHLLNAEYLFKHPEALAVLRMSTCPPIARDRLIGLSGVPSSLVQNMENTNNPRIPPKMSNSSALQELNKLLNIITKLLDRDIITWFNKATLETDIEIERACTIISDRLCGAMSDPIIRNAQEQRQLGCISKWLNSKNYQFIESGTGIHFNEMPLGSYAFRMNIPVKVNSSSNKSVNIPVDVVIKPKTGNPLQMPILIEAKSAGDFTNVNKRRKEEAIKISQLKGTYGDYVELVLFLCGYFDSGYLGYEAAEGIDWVWEHRIGDLEKCGL